MYVVSVVVVGVFCDVRRHRSATKLRVINRLPAAAAALRYVLKRRRLYVCVP